MTIRRGLTLGKYAPFHKGHQHVIETALAEMDEVLVLIYVATDVTDVPLSKRANWIRGIYPQVMVIEVPNGPQVVGDTAEIQTLHENYILKTLGINNISAFYSSEFYGEHMSHALGATNRLVDPERKIVPISGTEIRQNPCAYAHYLHPLVFRDLCHNL